MLTTVLAFLLTLSVLIAVHEWGHYRVARAFGVKVLRFSVGFGRVVWRRQRSPEAPEFALSALPLGGYVRMLDTREGPVAAHERDQAFDLKPLHARAAVVAAGPAANLILAVLLYSVAHWIGIEEPKAVIATPAAGTLADRAGLRAGDWVRAFSLDGGADWQDVQSLPDLRWRVTQAALDGQPLQLWVSDRQGHGRRNVVLPLDQVAGADVDARLMQQIGLVAPFSEPRLGAVMAGGAAAAAGLREGDLVLQVDGRPVGDAQSLRERIRAKPEQAMAWRLERDARVIDVEVLPRASIDDGQRIGRVEAYIGAQPERVTVRHGPIEGLVKGAERTWEVSALTLRMLGRMLVGEASLKNLSGPITIADYAGQSVEMGLAYYLGFLALVSVSLGVLNLLPLPMLDGGHLMYYLFEGLTGRPVSEWWLKWLQRGGALIMLLLMTLALSNDVARLFGLH